MHFVKYPSVEFPFGKFVSLHKHGCSQILFCGKSISMTSCQLAELSMVIINQFKSMVY